MASERVQRRREAARQRIVEAALALFAQQGFEATTVAQISEAADIGKGTFFTHFATKEAVFGFLSEQVVKVMCAADDPALGAEERIRRCFAAAGAWFDAHEVLARQMCLARMSVLGQVGASPFRGQLFELLESIVGGGVSSGQWRDVEVETGVQALAAAYFGAVAVWALEPGGCALTPGLMAQADVVLHGLLAA